MKKMGKIMGTAVLAATLALGTVGNAVAANNGQHGGIYTDFNNLTWEANDGTVTVIGRGTVFSTVHPEITDPEYYLKELVRYPHEEAIVNNSQGQPKANYDQAALAEMRKFVNSFDWIHSDELTRYQKVHDRIANGANGNYYKAPDGTFSVLLKGYGVCADFSEEFGFLCKIVGLEYVEYTPCDMHVAGLIKIGNQWFATDPTNTLPFISNGKTYPVDFETEYHRYEKEAEEREKKFMAENPDDPVAILMRMDRQLAAGEITLEQYNAKYMEMYGQFFN